MAWRALPRPSRSRGVTTLGDPAVDGILDTPVGDIVSKMVAEGIWNKTTEGTYARLPTDPIGGTGCAVAITEWMYEAGLDIYDASKVGIPTAAEPGPSGQGATIKLLPEDWLPLVANYFASAAGFVQSTTDSALAALRFVDWSVPWTTMPWEWLRAHGASVDWVAVLGALQSHASFGKATEPKHDFGTFGIFGWQKQMDGQSITWAEVPYELFAYQSFADAAKRYPWWLVDMTTVDGTAASMLAPIGLAPPASSSAPSSQAAFPGSSAPGTGTPFLAPGVVGLVKQRPIGILQPNAPATQKAPADTGSGVGWWLAGGAAVATAIALGMRKKGRK